MMNAAKIGYISMAVSISLHASVLGVLGTSDWFARYARDARMRAVPLPVLREEKPLSLQFVETPDIAEATDADAVDADTSVISDKTVTAKDAEDGEPDESATKTKEVSDMKQMLKAVPELPRHTAVPQPDFYKEQQIKQIEEAEKSAVAEDIAVERAVEPERAPPPDTRAAKMKYDIINMPELSESIYSSRRDGPVTFEARAHEIGPYFKTVKEKIERYWVSYLVFKYQNTAPRASTTVVGFKILFNGDVSEVDVLEHSGDDLFKDFCVASVINTAPFPPIPENLRAKLEREGGLGIVFTFRYN